MTVTQLAEAWKNFKPRIPLSYIIACRRAIKELRR